MDYNTIWNNVLEIISKKIIPITFKTWFNDTFLVDISNNIATIKVPMNCHKLMLQKNYYDILDNSLSSITNKSYELQFVTEEEFNVKLKPDIEIIESYIDKKNNINSNLNKKYTFDSFIIGDSNKFAHSAAKAVAESPGIIYNPLFIYGKSGLGKTHLMHAIGNYIDEYTNKTVLYITSDEFIHDFVGISNKNEDSNIDYIDHFKEKYRDIDVLMIDDIQFLGGAGKTQQEFFHTFNSLHSSDKQIIISSDRSPDDLKLLEERLRTRFAWGLTVNIFPPDYELRCKIIKNKISGHEVAKIIENSVIEYISNSCDNDVRHIEGAVTRLYVYAAMVNPKIIDLEFAIEALKDFVGSSNNIYSKNNIEKIINGVSKYYKLSVDDLISKKRNANINYPRQIAMYLCRMMTEESFPRIGSEFGNRDHTTIMHGVEKIERDLKNNSSLNNIIKEIKDLINN